MPSTALRVGEPLELEDFELALSHARSHIYTRTEQVALADLDGWYRDSYTGYWHHRSGRFFSIEGVRFRTDRGPISEWCQPIVNQPETGILGLLISRRAGVTYCLMQLKAEPGNRGGIQLSPTVQATRSNYTGVHGGSAVPYLEHFRDAPAARVLADVRQSEQGAWFLRKRNRNMIVLADDLVPAQEGFVWLSTGQLLRLLSRPDLVNMDTRTVLSLLPMAAAALREGADGLRAAESTMENWEEALADACAGGASRHSDRELRHWITDVRARTAAVTTAAPMRALTGWRHGDGSIRHETRAFFEVIGVRVEAAGREVGQWCQPMLATREDGIVAFLVTRIGGVPHVLLQLRTEPGLTDVAELAPTVQCTPGNYEFLPSAARPPFLDDVLNAPSGAIRFDTTLSDEGGRFYRISNRHLIVETGNAGEYPGFRWASVRQLIGLLRHSNYLNIQTRSLVACLYSLLATSAEGSRT
ncbi:NDP-hexose 2,3-dehydratase [Phytoactinopolyspora sp. XMNu-373]|uniref:NDP-hexose 2,3-dehydratase n=2 Tax=Phytoactinopolyspora mesophila TaxID=2650750 RepID=A0A7K3M0T3_9ACTN|nr:NDP-hexose 2,3-dehydratase [Phytoactinopolyspora mesophila]